MINKYQGSSLKIFFNLIPSEDSNFVLDGAEFVCSVTTHTYESLFEKIPVVNGDVLFVEITPKETSTMLGKYIYEIKIKDGVNSIGTLKREEFEILKSNNPTWGVEV